ncbi:MAG TPA: hypothetical protein VGO91_10395 [Pyrinomonadaceae bacterium]|jgi:hypothetical protein|nr:hypothetical protein [Pyrinomonadaceae bacterium]
MMTTQKLILPVALGAALLGGTVGTFVHLSKTAETANNTPAATTSTVTTANADKTEQARALNADKNVSATDEQTAQLNANGTDDQAAYREGFAEGFKTAQDKNGNSTTTRYAQSPVRVVNTPSRVVSHATRTRYVAQNSSRSAYYDYGQPRSRSFWQKHRDKLTVAMGAGGGSLLGALIGGKKGAAIGALAGGGGSALYTYKIRKRNRRY